MSYHTIIQEHTEAKGVLERVDFYRLDAARLLDPGKRSQMGQFMTPEPIARFMASLFGNSTTPDIHLLDAGAGVGSLCAAFVDEFVRRTYKPTNIQITAYELDPLLVEYLYHYSEEQIKRHNLIPGISGWSQVNGRNAISWEEKFKHDVWYVGNISFMLDLKILVMTLWNVLSRKGINNSIDDTMPFFKGNNKSVDS